MIISIHAPRRGSDGSSGFSPATAARFQSTLPVGGATKGGIASGKARRISIHAPRGGSDTLPMICGRHWTDFNPRSPWGERHFRICLVAVRLYFNPRSPWGERPEVSMDRIPASSISIHAPRRGSDGVVPSCVADCCNFNPRSPWGERRETTHYK